MKKIAASILLLFTILLSCTNRDGEIIDLINSVKKQNDDLKAQISALKKTTDSALFAVLKVNTLQVSTDKKIDLIQTDLKSVLTQIASLSTQMTAANADLTTLKAKIEALQVKCAELVAQIAALDPGSNLKNGLVAYYPFNGNANDASQNGYNGTVNGPILTTDRFGISKKAYLFGDNQEITIPNSSALNKYPISISLWYNTSRLADSEGSNIFSKYLPAFWNGFQIVLADIRNVQNNNQTFNDGFGVQSWYLRSITDKILGYYNEDSFTQKFVAKDTWYHYVFVVDKTGGKIYVNGKLIVSHNWTGTEGACNNNLLWKIGGKYSTWFNGKIDDVGIWNRAITPNEINFLYEQEFTVQ